MIVSPSVVAADFPLLAWWCAVARRRSSAALAGVREESGRRTGNAGNLNTGGYKRWRIEIRKIGREQERERENQHQ